jgi:hypothetical protein
LDVQMLAFFPFLLHFLCLWQQLVVMVLKIV